MKMMISNTYPLEWLDTLILQHLNPKRALVSDLSKTELAVISETLVKESNRIKLRIKNEIFSLRKKREIRLLVRKYHSTLIFLLDTIVDHHKSIEFQVECLAKTAELVTGCLDELLSFLENRFGNYLSLDERVPVTYLVVSRKELQLKLNRLKKRKSDCKQDQIILSIVVQELYDMGLSSNGMRVTFRQLLYERMLLKNLENWKSSGNNEGIFSDLDRTLIGINFNSSRYIAEIKNRLIEELSSIAGVKQKISFLSYCSKEFNQIYSNDKFTFNPAIQHLKTVLDDWFNYEILYLEKKIELSMVSISKGSDAKEEQGYKLECDLSADQIGIILRAADEARIVKSRSMSFVFQKIVPHLSTAYKKELSYQSVRSKSYNAEENDKNIAILTLEKMIKKIKTY